MPWAVQVRQGDSNPAIFAITEDRARAVSIAAGYDRQFRAETGNNAVVTVVPYDDPNYREHPAYRPPRLS